MKEESKNLMAIRFQYAQGVREDKFETIPFYKNKLRSLLKRNIGRAVWLKGGIIERPAYLIFYETLSEKVKDLLSEPLEYGGYFRSITPANPMEVIEKYARGERIAVGYLKLPSGLEIGSPETVMSKEETKILEKVGEGFYLTEYEFVRAEYAEISRINPEYVLLYNVEIKAPDGRTSRKDRLALKKEDLRLHRTFTDNIIRKYPEKFFQLQAVMG
ncbi:MAG: hypothetical protein QXH03_10955 [Candidatus Bathyarchaeia archaeon]